MDSPPRLASRGPSPAWTHRAAREQGGRHEDRGLLPEPDRRHGHGDADVPRHPAGFPGAMMAAVIRPQVAPTLDGTDWFDELDPLRPSVADTRTADASRSLRRLRRARFDLAVLLPNSFRSALVARLAGIPRRRRLRAARAGHPADRRPASPASTRRTAAAGADRRRLSEARPPPGLSGRLDPAGAGHDAGRRGRRRSGLGRAGPRRGEPVVCLNTGGAFGPAKNWPTGHFADLARRLAEQSGSRVLVLCGPARTRERAGDRRRGRVTTASSAWPIRSSASA